jgi:signal transduction histidine kinase
MRERAESMGGSLVLDSQPGRGTRVIVRVPVLIQPAEGS